ncbi:DUF2189 domain-containing protein [Pacificispira sp.]|uniref:DUF2189 domain-containing protein n=1 Tax=Pacificispira sp. TaxID=2888761 RepID=UPI003BAA7360
MSDRIEPPIDDGLAAFPHADRIRKVSTAAPFRWLLAGWQDFRRAKPLALLYGGLFAGISLAITAGLALLNQGHLIAPMWGGFFIVGPALTIGMYQISRQLEQGEAPTIGATLLAWRRNGYHVMTAGAVLMLFMMIWVRIAVIVFALTFPYVSLTFRAMVEQALFTPEGWGFLALGTAVGGVFAAFAFTAGAISLPAMLDRRIDIFSAVTLSAVAVFRNAKPMMIWGTVIVTVVAAGMATFYIGLVVALPLIGFASWHAYRDLYVRDPDPPAAPTEPGPDPRDKWNGESADRL